MKKKLLAMMLANALALPVTYAALWIPPGFESLANGQQEKISIAVGGSDLGLFDADVKLDTITLRQPEKVLAAMPVTPAPGSADYRLLQQLLSQPLKRHGEMACQSQSFPSAQCGYLQTDTLDSIYDDKESRLLIFVRQAWLKANNQEDAWYHPTEKSTTDALIHQQDLNLIAQKGYSAISLQGTGALGLDTNGYLGADWTLNASQGDYSSEQNIDVSDLYYRHDVDRRYYLQAGRMDNRTLSSAQGGDFSFQFLPLGTFNGVRAGTTLAYINRERAAQGTPLLVLLSQSSRVDAYRGEQLLGSFYLQPGNQQIDSSQFPSGSYTVTLQVYENNQLVRSESVPFAKSGGIGNGSVQWFFQGGQGDNTSYNSSEDPTVMQAGLSLPLGRWSTLTSGVAGVSAKQYAEVGLQLMPPFEQGSLNLEGHLLTGSGGVRGDSEQISIQRGIGVSLYRTSTSVDTCNTRDRQNPSNLGCNESLSATLSVPLLGWSGMLGYTRSVNHSVYDNRWDPQRSFNDNLVNTTEARSVSRSVQLSLSRAFTLHDWNISSSLGAFRREQSGYDRSDNGLFATLSLSRVQRQEVAQRSRSTTLGTSYQKSSSGNKQLAYNYGETWSQDRDGHKEVGVSLGGINTDQLNSALSGRVNGMYGNLSGVLSDSYDANARRHTPALSGSYSSSMAVSRQGVFWGGSGISGALSAGALVQVDALDDDGEGKSVVEARVSGRRPRLIPAGSSALFPLDSLSPVSLTVQDGSTSGAGEVSSALRGAGSKDLFLLPGKLRVRNVTLDKNYTWVGTLHFPQSVPSEVTALNATQLSLDEKGSFTAAVRQKTSVLYLLAQHEIYRCALKEEKQRSVVRFAGVSSCEPADYSALPSEIQHAAVLRNEHEKNGRAITFEALREKQE
ncbi:TcfC E-set like domain-containing protein [Enterobacter cloacae subsp. cloacae]|uniref:TcfC E-set like domain-containing protein n=1 Tax=Enterobacter cloacae TaxID=550 RepID=UPI001C5AE8EF|nr:TcfC E-set like domain-containing protein [Enterobacter cloacae]MBW4201917.1 TcfC E-set like domain-containing protein [Enterobacter cloacae subsp. cloacae]